jgi:hypothetical protein
MTITDITPHLRIKRSYEYDQYPAGIQELIDQVTCLQKSVANLRKDLSHLTQTSQKKDRSFWIHW